MEISNNGYDGWLKYGKKGCLSLLKRGIATLQSPRLQPYPT